MILKNDIHSHILFGVDDGFRKAEDSISALKKMQEMGVKKLFLTPHLNPDVYPNSNENIIIEHFNEFKKTILPAVDIDVRLAAEYMVVEDFENFLPKLTFNGSDKYVLIEMSYYYKSNNILDTIFNLVLNDYKPILAHPERYLYQYQDLKFYDKVKDMGCLLQMNALSYIGIYGKESMKILKYLKKNGMYDFIGSDLHSLSQLKKITDVRIKRRDDKFISNLVENNNKIFG